MHVYTWKDPEINQMWTVNQANQNNGSKENQKKCPIQVIQTATRMCLSPCICPCCLSTYTVLFFPPNKMLYLFHYFTSLWGFCLSLLQRIFPTQGSNPGLPHCRQILYQLSHKGSPRILQWVAYTVSSGSS